VPFRQPGFSLAHTPVFPPVAEGKELPGITEPSAAPFEEHMSRQYRHRAGYTATRSSAQTIRRIAQSGLRSPASTLPYIEQIQRSFGHHPVTSIQAHLGPRAAVSAELIGASAYATGNHVIFTGKPDLFTAAHEAAHVVQQRHRPALQDGIGREGDFYERRANEIASRVVSGQSAEELLDRSAASQQNRESKEGVLGEGDRSPSHSADSAAPAPMVQMMRPHPEDVGRLFHVRWRGNDQRVGRYLGESANGQYRFSVRGANEILLDEQDIIGYRPTVGQRYPTGNKRPVEDRLRDRSFIMLSGGDLSEAMARQRMDPQFAEQMATTTYEAQPNYQSYQENAENLRRLGVPILNNIDLSRPQSVSRLKEVPEMAHFHFQMPRVPRATPGYSTQKLIRDTASLPETLKHKNKRRKFSLSITTPGPSAYKEIGIHNRIYGLESGKALKGTGMQVSGYESDEDLEQYGYTHKQSTTDASTEAALLRRTYHLTPVPANRENEESEENEDEKPEKKKKRKRETQD
jgi:hypothetical protein